MVALVRPVKFQLWSQVDNDRSLCPRAYWKCALEADLVQLPAPKGSRSDLSSRRRTRARGHARTVRRAARPSNELDRVSDSLVPPPSGRGPGAPSQGAHRPRAGYPLGPGTQPSGPSQRPTSHSARTLKAHERRAAHLQTGGRCQGAGCHRGPGCRLIPHHADPWAQCHTTSLADTVLLCEQTHPPPPHRPHHPAQRRPLARTRRLGPRTQ
jgi:hypothetical protein